MIKYSVIIPYHSNKNLLSACLTSLDNTLDSSDSEIIIVDNNESGSQMISKEELPQQTRIIYRAENLMYPRAVNLGAEHARGEILLLCDADTCVTNGFQIALEHALKNGDIGFAAPKLINMQTGKLLEFGITSSFYNFPHPYAGRRTDFQLINSDHQPLAACAACSAIKKSVFYDLNGFDIQLVHSYSDIDLCIRLMNRGYKTICIANTQAYHCGASTSGSGMGASLKEDTKGIFMSKHPNIPVEIQKYIEQSCIYLNDACNLYKKEYFLLDCSTIANPDLYYQTVIDMLRIKNTGKCRIPFYRRDAINVDYINFIPHQIRNYRIPILYFVDSFLSFSGNTLWKSCRKEFKDIVVDRHANVEWLHNV